MTLVLRKKKKKKTTVGFVPPYLAHPRCLELFPGISPLLSGLEGAYLSFRKYVYFKDFLSERGEKDQDRCCLSCHIRQNLPKKIPRANPQSSEQYPTHQTPPKTRTKNDTQNSDHHLQLQIR